MAKKILYGLTENLIAHKFITSASGSLSERAKRKYESFGSEIAERLKNKDKLQKDSGLVISLKWDDNKIAYARKISLAMQEFEQVNPTAYEQFQELMGKHKAERRSYIEFGGNIEDSVYIGVVEKLLKVGPEKAENIYNGIVSVSEALGKSKSGTQTMLLPE